jgi:uncharacterized protein
MSIDLLLFGTGLETYHPTPTVRKYLESLEIGFEVSSTVSAVFFVASFRNHFLLTGYVCACGR